MTQVIAFGKSVIHVETPDFVKGVEAGQRNYSEQLELDPSTWTDRDLEELFLEQLESMEVSTIFGIGFVVGWLQAFSHAEGVADERPFC
jgi:hypothetical protein